MRMHPANKTFQCFIEFEYKRPPPLGAHSLKKSREARAKLSAPLFPRTALFDKLELVAIFLSLSYIRFSSINHLIIFSALLSSTGISSLSKNLSS